MGRRECLIPSWVPWEEVPGRRSTEEWLRDTWSIRPDGTPIDQPKVMLTSLETPIGAFTWHGEGG